MNQARQPPSVIPRPRDHLLLSSCSSHSLKPPHPLIPSEGKKKEGLVLLSPSCLSRSSAVHQEVGGTQTTLI